MEWRNRLDHLGNQAQLLALFIRMISCRVSSKEETKHIVAVIEILRGDIKRNIDGIPSPKAGEYQ